MRLFPLSFLLLAACGTEAPPAQKTAVAPPPPQLCDQARKGLDALGKSGAVDVDDKGEATIVQEAWFRMTAEQREELAKTLGFHAACTSPDGTAERRVMARDEYGTILMDKIVPTVVDLRTLEDGSE
jgi:hypothetical protein